MGFRVCRKCRKRKSLTEFYRRKNGKDGRDTVCADCTRDESGYGTPAYREKRNEHRKRNLDQVLKWERQNHLKRKFGITLAEYDVLFESQKGLCAVCGNPELSFNGRRRLAVDHDHVSGKIRGLLCFKCNRAIGGFNDDPSLLTKAANYLCRIQS